MGFKEVKRDFVAAVLENRYRCVARAEINTTESSVISVHRTGMP
jgi:hypothetical protein